MSRDIAQGTVAVLPFSTRTSQGVLVDADATPTITNIQVNGADQNIAGATIAQQQDSVPANITGRYAASVPTTTLSANDQVEVHISATIDGVARTASLCFTTVERSAGMPTIDTGC